MNNNNNNSVSKRIDCYEDDYKSMKNRNSNFNFEFDIDEAGECFLDEIKNTDNKDCEEVYEKGFKDGYEKAKQEVLVYMKKNKCYLKFKDN